jgi:hypothetical protein
MSNQALLLDSSRALCEGLPRFSCIFLPIGYLSNLMRILQDDSTPDWHTVTDSVGRRAVHRAYDASYAWLTQPRSFDELDNVVNSSCLCEPPTLDSQSHKMGRKTMRLTAPDSPPFHTLLLLILSPFEKRDFVFDSAFALHKMHRLSRRQVWPRSVRTLLPHGPEGTIRALIQLFRIDMPLRHYAILYITLGRTIRFVHPLVLPYIVTSTTFLFHGVLEFSKKHVLIRNQGGEVMQQQINMQAVTALFEFAHCMTCVTVRHANNVQRITFNNQQPSASLDAITHCVNVCHAYLKGLGASPSQSKGSPYSLLTDTIGQLGTVGGQLLDDCPITRTCFISTAAKDAFHKKAWYIQPFFQPPSHRFRYTMHHLDIAQRCAAPKCTRTRADGRLKRCSGCLRVCYCSRTCQKNAWRGKISHRSVCSTIEHLCTALDVPEQEVFKWASIPVLDRSVSEQSARLVVEHFDLLAARHMAASRMFAITTFEFATDAT